MRIWESGLLEIQSYNSTQNIWYFHYFTAIYSAHTDQEFHIV